MDNIPQLKRREILKDLIEEWNANRLDLFAITPPDENLEYHGVMRFLFQDEGAKLATKCIRVSSKSSTDDVIETLVEKFRPDMKMLTTPIYYLLEVDSNGMERKLQPDEYPLEVQLNWTKDEKEGKFVLRNAAHKPINVNKADKHAESSFKRKLSKREKKEQKKKEKERGEDSDKEDEEPSGMFVRTKSNSEAVMRRRREMKVQKKLDEIQKEGDHGGLLKIHGDSLNIDVPYKSLLLSVTDTAAYVVNQMLDKYGLSKVDPTEYCLVQVFNAHAGEIGGGLRPQEHVLEDDECPLAILQHQVNRGNITFHVRRRDGKRTSSEDSTTPFLLELNMDGTDVMKPKKHMLHINMTEVGSIAQPSSGQHLRMIGPTILPHHAVIANIEGVVTVTPTSPQAECYVEGTKIHETTVLQHGKVVRFGHHHAFRFFDPKVEEQYRKVSENHLGPPSTENGPPAYSSQLDDVLPAGLEFRDEGEDNFLHSVISDVTEGMCQFKLAPCYSLYLAARYRVDRVKPGMSMDEHLHKLSAFCNKISFMIRDCVTRFRNSPQELAFWMANMSELLHFLKMDRDLNSHSLQAQDILADTVQDAFKDLIYIMQGDLYQSMPAFLVDSDNDNEAGEVLHVLSSAMSLLRRCRVNAALTIQLFSQLFHFVNMWLFNKLVMEPQLGLITRQWGIRLKRRLDRISSWAEKQGLELAADCRLCRIVQAADFLQAPKQSPDDIAAISSTCYKLNSLQLRVLLEQYRPEPGEMPHIPQDMIERVISVARNTAGELLRPEDSEMSVAEDTDLQLPFLLPEDGYTSDTTKGIPQGLADFLEPVMADSLCRLTPLPSQSGSWQVFMIETEDPNEEVNNMPPEPMGPGTLPTDQGGEPQEPEVIQIQLHKVNGSMGLSIVAAKGESQLEKGIYIKSVVGDGAADRDGRLMAGDQLLEVDSRSLVGLSQERAADLMKETGQVVNLRVAKQGAIYHGLATLLNQPTPPMSRGGPPPPQDNPSYMSQSKSTPLLNDSFNKPQFGNQQDDMRSKSQGNLMRPDEVPGWQGSRSPGPPDSRVSSQPNLDGRDSPNYLNYPGADGPNQRPPSQYGVNAPHPAATQPANRPRSEFVDPNWYPPPIDASRQPIYQNHAATAKPPGRFDDRELPAPPNDERRFSMPNQHADDEGFPLPPPPSTDYVNYNGPQRFASESMLRRAPDPRFEQPVSSPGPAPPQSYDGRGPRPDARAPDSDRTPADAPPWARGGSQKAYPGARAPGQVSPQSPGSQPPARPVQPGDLMRAPPQIQPYRPPHPSSDPSYRPPSQPMSDGYRPPHPSTDSYRSQDSFRGSPRVPQPGDALRGQAPRPIRPQAPYNQPAQGYQPPANHVRGMRPPAPHQMGGAPTAAAPWQRENDNRRVPDEWRLQRDSYIRDLESRPYRTPDEEERLGRLRLDADEESRSLGRSMSNSTVPGRPQAMGPPGQPPVRRVGLPSQPTATLSSSSIQPDVPAAVKRDMLQSKTVTFKPAYREDTMRPTGKPNMGPDPTDSRNQPMNSQQDLLRHQRDPSGSSYALSTPEREVLRNRLEEELREKQRRDSQEARRSFISHEDEEMRRRREHELNQRQESDRIQMQHMMNAQQQQQRYMDGPPPQRQPIPRDYPAANPAVSQQNRFSQPALHNEPPVSMRHSAADVADPSRPIYNNSNRFSVPKPYQPAASTDQASYPTSNYQSTRSPAYPSYSAAASTGIPQPGVDKSSNDTPGVIGSQEVYKDPRLRIEAQKRSQSEQGDATERMSFREKMKMFASEAGESTPVQRPKASKSQRALEETLSYGNGHYRNSYNGN